MNILFNIPNLIDYVRLCLLIFAWYYFNRPYLFLSFYLCQVLLDAVDGWIARRFRQVSRFGAWLDSVIDIIGRTILWTKLSSSGIFVITIEWLALIALSNVNLSLSNDIIVRNLTLNGFQTLFGFITLVCGSHFLPIVMYTINAQILSSYWCLAILHNIQNLCIIGRLFSFYYEIYVIRLFIIDHLLSE